MYTASGHWTKNASVRSHIFPNPSRNTFPSRGSSKRPASSVLWLADFRSIRDTMARDIRPEETESRVL